MLQIKASALILCSALCAVAVASCQSNKTRDQLINRIEVEYLSNRALSSSPLIATMIQDARKANPNAPEEIWPKLKLELIARSNDVLFGKDAAADHLVRHALASMSTDQLARLAVLLDDPSYKQFVSAMSSADAQRELLVSIMKSSLQLSATWNSILQSHQLQGVH